MRLYSSKTRCPRCIFVFTFIYKRMTDGKAHAFAAAAAAETGEESTSEPAATN